jgi:hypothetical protein
MRLLNIYNCSATESILHFAQVMMQLLESWGSIIPLLEQNKGIDQNDCAK